MTTILLAEDDPISMKLMRDALQPNTPALQLHQLAGQRQAQAGPGRILAGPKELLKDALVQTLRNPGPGIPHLKYHLRSLATGGKRYRPLLRSELHRVAEQV